MPWGSHPVRSEMVNSGSGRAARSSAAGPRTWSGVTPMNWNPSPDSIARRRDRSTPPPIQNGMRCAGFGSTRRSSKELVAPWKLTRIVLPHGAPHLEDLVQARAPVVEALAERLVLARDHPTPTPRVRRPPDSASRLASVFASSSGGCCGTTSTLVPSPISVVTAAAHVSVTIGSKRWGDG